MLHDTIIVCESLEDMGELKYPLNNGIFKLFIKWYYVLGYLKLLGNNLLAVYIVLRTTVCAFI